MAPDARDVFPRTVAVIEDGMRAGTHLGAQLCASLDGKLVGDVAVGQADRGVPMTTDTLMPWYSMTKAVTVTAAVQQWERGAFDLDDPVAAHVPAFAANGKDNIRIRHLFTHTAGIRGADTPGSFTPAPGASPEGVWDAMVAHVCAAEPEQGWVPGRRAGYHLGSLMVVLGELVRRADGRPFGRYVREEILEPLGMADCWVGMPPDVFRAYGDRIGVMHLTTTPEPQPFPLFATAEEAAVSVPGGGGRGPMRELVCLYELLLGRGARGDVRLLSPVAVEAMTARQRVGLVDETYNIVVDWSLGLAVDLISYGRHCSPRTFGHGGMLSSVAFCDPEAGLAAAMVFNGLPTNDAHYLRLEAASTALYEDLGLADGPGRDHALPAVTLG